MNKKLEDKLKTLPRSSGVYFHKDKSGEIIYVGKAKNLKKRVKSYFNKENTPKTKALVSKIADIDFMVTATESEAFILECNLIKKYKPRYNVCLKDDKTYPYIKISLDEKWSFIPLQEALKDPVYQLPDNYIGTQGISWLERI